MFADYKNVRSIIRDIGAKHNICPLKDTVIADNDNGLSFEKIKDMNLFQVMRRFGVDYWTILKAYYLFLLPQSVLEKYYSNTPILSYLGGYSIVKLIIGPALGLEATRSYNTYGSNSFKRKIR